MYVCQLSLERPILLVAWEEEAQFEASRRGKIWPQFFKYICARHEPYCSGQEGGEPTLDLRVTTAMRREEREKRNEDTKLFNVDEKKHKICCDERSVGLCRFGIVLVSFLSPVAWL